jgi:hypothetical protein
MLPSQRWLQQMVQQLRLTWPLLVALLAQVWPALLALRAL